MNVQHTLIEHHPVSEAQAFADIAARSWHAVALDILGKNEDLHWHDFDTVVYVIRGTACAVLEDGSMLKAHAGSRIEAPAGWVHRDVVESNYRAVFGFSVRPSDFTQPVNKPLPFNGGRA